METRTYGGVLRLFAPVPVGGAIALQVQQAGRSYDNPAVRVRAGDAVRLEFPAGQASDYVLFSLGLSSSKSVPVNQY